MYHGERSVEEENIFEVLVTGEYYTIPDKYTERDKAHIQQIGIDSSEIRSLSSIIPTVVRLG
jgi:hypothetical protein